MPTSLILAILVITIVLAGLVAVRPNLTVARGGKILAFLASLSSLFLPGCWGLRTTWNGRSKRHSV